MTRETAYAALFARLQTAVPTYFATRELIPATQLQNWPGLIVTATEQTAMQGDGRTAPTLWRLGALAALCIERDPDQLFEPQINAIIDQVVAVLDPEAGESSWGDSYHTTLGDVVIRAWVEGDVEIHREVGDMRAVVLIPIEMLAQE